MQTYVHMCTRTYAYIRTHDEMCTCTHTHMYSHIHMCTYLYVRTHGHMFIHVRAKTKRGSCGITATKQQRQNCISGGRVLPTTLYSAAGNACSSRYAKTRVHMFGALCVCIPYVIKRPRRGPRSGREAAAKRPTRESVREVAAKRPRSGREAAAKRPPSGPRSSREADAKRPRSGPRSCREAAAKRPRSGREAAAKRPRSGCEAAAKRPRRGREAAA
jgi:hypothetical protein